MQFLARAAFHKVPGGGVQAVTCLLEVDTSGEVSGTKHQRTSPLCTVQQHACKR